MKQVLIRGGRAAVEDVPAPAVEARTLLVRVEHSCVSAGTEISSIAMSALPLYRRALKQREHARRVLDLAYNEGFMRTYKRVRATLAAGLATGYSAAGTIVALGADVDGFKVGGRVACAGAGVANHAEMISVPVNLAVQVPDGLGTEVASTVTLGAIALQGVRRANPTLGETFAVIGLGILGQLTAQLLRSGGAQVIGTDLDRGRVDQSLAAGMEYGVTSDEDFPERVRRLTDGFGADAVIITAATESNAVIRDAFQACRKKGRVVLVGDVSLDLQRSDMYEKELDFLISTSYGPGRYDPVYELEGQDYPIGYVRWTENRNMAEYLRLLADGRVSLAHVPTETYPIDDAEAAYRALAREGAKPLVVLIEYPRREEAPARVSRMRSVTPRSDRILVALVGAGGFAQGTHEPNLLKLRDSFAVRAVMSRTGATAKAVAGRTGAAYATTDFDEILADDFVDLVLIATRHHLHEPLALRALEAGKHVFVEKPLALDREQLARIEAFYADRDGPLLMTGFNRRFAPPVVRARELLAGRATPLVADYRLNAGSIPREHWVHGPEGGGRNIGEACHIYDLFDSLTGAEVADVTARAIAPPSRQWTTTDNFVATISYADGSVCTLTYTALGSRAFAKEVAEVFVDGMVLSLNDYKSLAVSGRRARGWRRAAQQKGHLEELEALAAALRSGAPWPISLEEQVRATRISFDVEDQINPVAPSPAQERA